VGNETATVPTDPTASTPVGVTNAMPVAVSVPTEPVAETPTTSTTTLGVLPLKGITAKEVKPNII
jgi:hypothetical protein